MCIRDRGTFEWASLRLFGRVPKEDLFVVILVSVVTVFTDLAVAVLTGVLVSALVFAWKSAKHIEVKETTNDHGTKMYLLNGPLFFASTKNFQDKFDPANDPEDVIIDFKNSRVCDHSAIEAINASTDTAEAGDPIARPSLKLLSLAKQQAGSRAAVKVLKPLTERFGDGGAMARNGPSSRAKRE